MEQLAQILSNKPRIINLKTKKMKNQIKINLLYVKDYISMRKRKLASHVAWLNVKSLNMPNGNTFWQMLLKTKDYNPEHEPSLTQLKEVERTLKLKK